MNKLLPLLKKNLSVLLNAGAMVGTTAITSLMGFAYWVVASWFFSKHAMGLADAMFSLMSLLGAMSMMGLGTLLTGELTRQPGKEWSLINTALIVSGGVGIAAGVIFAFVAPFLSPQLNYFGSNILDIILFALGVSLTALTMVFDQSVIGILRGDLQLWRNTLFSAVKLGLLFVCYFLLWHTSMAIYVTWLLGNVLSLSVIFIKRSKKKAQETQGEMPIAASRSLAFSGPLTLSGPLTVSRPLTNFERSIRLPCPDCGTLSSNSASFCLNCGYPFSPTVEISSVRPQLLFDYGVIGLSESSMFKKRKSIPSNNTCPECGNASPDYAMYCATCGYPLTPTIEMPSLKAGLSQLAIEAQDTLPLLAAIQREKAQQALSAESTLLMPNPVKNTQRPAAFQRTPLPVDAEETLIANLPKTPRTIENAQKPNLLDLKRSALFLEDEQTLDLPHLPSTPRTREAHNTPLPQEVQKVPQKSTKTSIKPEWGFIRKLGRVAIQHHVVNLVLLAPTQILPILVLVLVSVDSTTSFYDSFMLANFVFSLTYSLTTVLHAVSSAQPAILAQKIRFTLLLSLIASVGANLVLQVGAGLLLSLFRLSDMVAAAWCLRILSLAVFPIIIKSHFIAICRVHDRTAYMIIPIAIGSTIELGLAAVGAHFDGLVGLSLGWFATLILEALYMAPTVYRAANPVNVNIPVGIGKNAAKA